MNKKYICVIGFNDGLTVCVKYGPQNILAVMEIMTKYCR